MTAVEDMREKYGKRAQELYGWIKNDLNWTNPSLMMYEKPQTFDLVFKKLEEDIAKYRALRQEILDDYGKL